MLLGGADDHDTLHATTATTPRNQAGMPPPDSARSSLPLAAAPMSGPTPSSSPSAAPPPNPLTAASSFLHHHLSRLASHLTAPRPALAAAASRAPEPQGASLSLALAPDEVARTLIGTPVFTVCNSNNEFVLVSDPATGLRSLGLLCFRSEDADALLSHVFVSFCRHLLSLRFGFGFFFLLIIWDFVFR